MGPRPLPYLLAMLALAAVYFGAAKLGLSMAFVAEQVSPVWPPTGIALTAVLLLGCRVWPGLALGAFLANATANEPLGTACGIAVGNTLEALVGAWLLRRVVGFDRSLGRLKDVLGLAVLAAMGSTAVSATIGVTSLCLGGVQPWSAFGTLWWVWWLGDATGSLIVAPAILAWSTPSRRRWQPREVAEALLLAVTLVGVGLTVFAARLPWLTTDHPLEFAIFPFIIWAALRFGQRGTVLVTLAASAMAIWGTLHGFGPFSRGTVHESLTLLQTYTAAVAVTALLMGAALMERDLAERRQAADLAITHTLAESASLAEATPRILRQVCECLGWDLGGLWVVDPEARVLRYVETWQRPELGAAHFEAVSRRSTFAPGDGLPGRVWESGEPAWIADVTQDANFPRGQVAAKEGLRGAFGFPIRLGEEVLGVIEFFSHEVRQPDQHLLRMFAAIGSQVGQFIDRKRAEARLRESERNLRLIAENTADVVFAYDLERRLLYVNPAFEALTGYSVAELRQRHFIDYLHPEDASRMRALLEGAFRGERFDGEEFRIVTRTGQVKWCLSSWGPLLDASGTRIGAQGREHDITERKRAEEALREADHRKDEFLAVLAHELRNPLAPMTNALRLIRLAGDDRAAMKEAQGVLERQIRQMVRLIDDLMDISRISRNKLELRKEWVAVAAVVQSAVETVRPLFEASGQHLAVTLPPDPLALYADPVRLAQVFSNLLSNAAKYSDPGGLVTLTAEREGSEVVVRVRDEGVGIPTDQLAQVFEMFVQLDQPGRSRGGLGIGLTLVRRLVDEHGGSVAVRSDGPGRGSEFVVRLPLASDGRADGGERPPCPARVSPRASLSIVVADDNVDAAESLGKLLRAAGHEVRVTHDGPAALEAVLACRPDVVFLDIGMPGLSGHEVARRLRQSPSHEGVMLVAVTGWGQDQDRRRSDEAGFDRHLVKPVDLEALDELLIEVASTGRPAAGAR